MEGQIDSASLNTIALDITRALTEEGFLLTRSDPFIDWVHGREQIMAAPEDLGLSFYIVDPPVPPVAPFDSVTVFISFESAIEPGIYFRMTFYFHNDLALCMDSHEIHEVYDNHNRVWFNQISDYLTEVEHIPYLSWDTEYDETIEDSLAGHIPVESADTVLWIMKTLKLQYERHKHRGKSHER
jgi:hypothetical protein